MIGLGLIGGSIAKCLKETHVVYGVDTDKNTQKLAQVEGIECVDNIQSLPGPVDIIFVATPILETINQLKNCAKHIHYPCIITDTASVKKIIFEQLPVFQPNIQFCSGHPMAGSEKAGFENASQHLFEHKNYLLIHSTTQTPKLLLSLLTELKVTIQKIGIDEHDKAMAKVSHVPFLLSTLALYDIEESVETLQNLVGPGFKDLTRIAASNPKWAQEIVMTNKDPILDDLKRVAKGLHFFEDAIKSNTQLLDTFTSIKKLRKHIFE